MPESFVPLLTPGGRAAVTGFRSEPAPTALVEVRRFQVSDAAVSVVPRPAFDVVGSAAIPAALVRAAREQACEDGFAAGYAAGLEASRKETAQDRMAARAARDVAAEEAGVQVAAAVRAVQDAARRLEHETATVADALAHRTLTAVAALTTAVLGHALSTGEDSALDAVRRALDPLPGSGPVVLAMSPQDADIVRLSLARADGSGVDPLLAGREVTVVDDPGLHRGDAVATSGVTEVDARLEASWQRALDELRR